jgi:hypothetical protein
MREHSLLVLVPPLSRFLQEPKLPFIVGAPRSHYFSVSGRRVQRPTLLAYGAVATIQL